ncbi:hypothetical protein [Thermomonospora amylolytica]|uniref:hypothetical protein n=1 Tax=Thermomonospora amylolytica TaxID=1411117 RepID=UPI000E6BE968|nr:hypothetical protein [Thermomonospora amylolytica]
MNGRFRGSRPRRPRRLRRETDGRLFDLDRRRFVDPAELGDDVRAGRPFRAHRQGTGEECTNEVLAEVLRNELSRQAGLVDLLRMTAPAPDERQRRRP